MTQFADNLSEDPLARVIDAFVDQSVPEGPDEFTKFRLVAAMRAADRTHERPVELGAAGATMKRPRRFVGLAAAATVAAAATAGVLTMGPGSRAPDPAGVVDPQQVVEAPRLERDAELRALVGVLEDHLRLDRGRILEREDVWKMASAMIQANPRLSNSNSWRVAQEKLSDVLERPEVIGLSLGVISTLPQFARF